MSVVTKKEEIVAIFYHISPLSFNRG
jgi:hypothetical protein